MGFLDSFGTSVSVGLGKTIVKRSRRHSLRYGLLLTACAILPVFIPDVWITFLHWWSPASTGGSISGPLGEHILRWSLSLAPVAVILHHSLHVLYVRHHDFPTERSPETKPTLDLSQLKELYFGGASIAIKFGIP